MARYKKSNVKYTFNDYKTCIIDLGVVGFKYGVGRLANYNTDHASYTIMGVCNNFSNAWALAEDLTTPASILNESALNSPDWTYFSE